MTKRVEQLPLTVERLERALVLLAYFIELDGDVHLSMYEKFEAELWKIADDLRANSGLASNEYFMPIMGLIFLRYATNRFYEARDAIEADKATGRMPDRPLIQADFTSRRALMLPESARFRPASSPTGSRCSTD